MVEPLGDGQRPRLCVVSSRSQTLDNPVHGSTPAASDLRPSVNTLAMPAALYGFLPLSRLVVLHARTPPMAFADPRPATVPAVSFVSTPRLRGHGAPRLPAARCRRLRETALRGHQPLWCATVHQGGWRLGDIVHECLIDLGPEIGGLAGAAVGQDHRPMR